MIDVRRAAQRHRSGSPGVTSFHCFSAGAHFDPDNVAHGPVIACDEHLVDPGAGFDTHAHRRVELVSWVLDGTLRHSDPSGRSTLITTGRAQYQRAGTGMQHAEVNASQLEPLHFVQLWILCDDDLPDYDVAPVPMSLARGSFDVLRRCRDHRLDAHPFVHLYVGRGDFHLAGTDLVAGDSVRIADEAVVVDGDGELLVVTVEA